jgi:hypothetical protein
MINTVVLIATSPPRVCPTSTGLYFLMVQNEPAVNSGYSPRKITRIGPSIGNRTQYQNDYKYKGQQQANRSCNRALVTHSAYLDPHNGSLRLRKLITSSDFMS